MFCSGLWSAEESQWPIAWRARPYPQAHPNQVGPCSKFRDPPSSIFKPSNTSQLSTEARHSPMPSPGCFTNSSQLYFRPFFTPATTSANSRRSVRAT